MFRKIVKICTNRYVPLSVYNVGTCQIGQILTPGHTQKDLYLEEYLAVLGFQGPILNATVMYFDTKEVLISMATNTFLYCHMKVVTDSVLN